MFALCAASDQAAARRDDIAFLQAVQAALAKRSGPSDRSPEDIDAAVRQLVAKAIVANDGIIDVFTAAGLKLPDISIVESRNPRPQTQKRRRRTARTTAQRRDRHTLPQEHRPLRKAQADAQHVPQPSHRSPGNHRRAYQARARSSRRRQTRRRTRPERRRSRLLRRPRQNPRPRQTHPKPPRLPTRPPGRAQASPLCASSSNEAVQTVLRPTELLCADWI